jgi:hypothetical protein
MKYNKNHKDSRHNIFIFTILLLFINNIFIYFLNKSISFINLENFFFKTK